jgi:hypothetical protein
MILRRWLTISLVVGGLLLVAGTGCNGDVKEPKVQGSKPTLVPLPPPGGPGSDKNRQTPQ